MNFKLNRSELAKITSKLVKVLPSKVIQPHYSWFRIYTEDKIIKLGASDGSTTMISNTSETSEKDFLIAVDGHTLAELSKNFISEAVEFEIGDVLRLKAGKAKAEIALMDTNYLQPLNTKLTGYEHIPDDTFFDLLDKVSNTASKDNYLQHLNSVFINPLGEKTDIVSADGFALSKATVEKEFNLALLLPLKSVKEIIELSKTKKVEKIFYDTKTVSVKAENDILTARLIDASFPDYTKLLPASFKTSLEINLEELKKHIKIVSVLTSENTIILDILDDQLVIKSKSVDKGYSESVIENVVKTGENLTIGFNLKLLGELLSNTKSEKIKFNFNGSDKAIYFTTEEGVYNLLMPLKLR